MIVPLLLLALIGTAAAVCPAGYQQINGGDCFKIYSTQQNYVNAEAQCVQDGGHLASVHSDAEETALRAIMGTTTPLIGMKCTDDTAAHCTWVDGTANDFTQFPGTGPVVAFGMCVHLTNTDAFWYPWNCDSTIYGYICRIPFNAPVTTCTGDYVPYNGGCAALKKTVRNQAEAEAACVLEGGHLASIHSEADNTFYANLATTGAVTNNIYTGLAWNTAGSAYMWTDATVYTYSKFAAPNFPNTVFGECVQMILSTEFGTAGQWTNIPCSTTMAYVCWKPDGATPTKAPAVCPSIQFFYDQGTVYSPNFPVSIPAGQSCEYVLATAVGTKVSVTFPIFSTDATTSLALYDGLDETIATTTLTGNTIDPTHAYESKTNVMKMMFTASATATGTGFQANFESTGGVPVVTVPPFDPTKQCPSQQYTADTHLYSPNWPDAYPPMSDCLYYINSRDNKKMSIEFGYMDTEQCCDVVTVYDGPSNTSPVLALVSGKNADTPTQYYSTGTTLTLQFTSDSNNEGQGWVATVRNL